MLLPKSSCAPTSGGSVSSLLRSSSLVMEYVRLSGDSLSPPPPSLCLNKWVGRTESVKCERKDRVARPGWSQD